jgi:hypothetical protein
MKLRALVYKEFRECLPYVLGAAVLLIACGFTSVQIAINPNMVDYRFATFSADNDYWQWDSFHSSFIQPAGAFLLLFAVALGISIGIRQYAAESLVRTWGYLLHRSVNRGTILFAKLFSALLSFIPLIIIWSIFYMYAHDKRYFPIPPTSRIFIEGLIFTAFGYVAYLAIAMAALSKAKWYTTKKVSIAFGIWMFINLIVQWQLFWAWMTIIIASAILLVQITDSFLNREFE